MVTHHPAKFGGQMHRGSGNIIILVHSVHWGINPNTNTNTNTHTLTLTHTHTHTPQKTPPSFLQTVQAPLFRQFPLYIGFS